MRRILPVIVFLIAGCSSLYRYESVPQSHVVRAGDTLYSIAFSYGIDSGDLAAWNRLGNPDRIIVGQRLSLRPSGTAAAAPAGRRAPVTTAAPRTAPARSAAGSAAIAWQWPASGRIEGRFGDRRVLATGIGIAGVPGQDILAAASGRIVYVGSGLPDYGQLVIVEHGNGWLSAYGHNRRILVGQNDRVSAGDRIAEMGNGPDGSARLHFEIRRNGDPLDPLTMLPPLR